MSPPPLQPTVWQPPPAPARARQRLSDPPMPPLTVVPLPRTGPEDVVLDSAGRLVTGTADGTILRLDVDTLVIEEIANTGGRPLGVELLGDDLLVCDAFRGLLRIAADTGAVESLCAEAAGVSLRFCNNAAVAADGTIYFTDSSQRFTLDHWRGDLVEHSGTGRLIRRDPNGATDVLLDGLQFANGVALARDESFVAVAETGAYCVRRVWLTGERAGTAEMLTDNLPGFPDNIATGSDGLIWVALGSTRNPALDWLLPRPAWLRKAMWAVPERLQPGPVRTAWVVALDSDGAVAHDFQQTHPAFHFVTGVREVGGRVYLGSLIEPALAWFDKPAG